MGKEAIELFRTCIPVFQTLSDPHRQDILLLLSEHSRLTVNEITDYSQLSRPAISHHLKLLKDKGLVTVEQQGTLRYYSLALEDSVALLKQLLFIVERDCIKP
ncbi:ArsR/SmtB family transcription factor [Paenibacillus donghaensis]|uniref:Transcriptional regulator n=1 Tax=Paenibacillus donghaensis TaxID=414771 RepID=A0A2Z2KMD0_9BACL|nr:metalloregulator ArsR/SmtB family transcription factor [Paenibacillus donghaensis]ASA24660.1 transcriptional regulator [Paenibacillus donghaensis]